MLKNLFNKYENKIIKKRLENKTYSITVTLDNEDQKKWINNPCNEKIIKLCSDYLGGNVVTFAIQINHLFENEWQHESMQFRIESVFLI